MEMEICSSSSSFFPWDLLPVNLQESILSLLPISTLLRCTAVSRSLRSVIRSPPFLSSYHQNYQNNPQPLFPFYHHPSTVADAYDPLLDRWISLPISAASSSSSAYISVKASAGPLLLLLASPLGFILSNPFSSSSPSPVIQIPSGATLHDRGPFYPIALFPETLQHFKIVMANTADHLSSLIYDSKTGDWEMNGGLDRRVALITNALVLNGLVYCLSRDPDFLLTFDPAGGRWEVLDVFLPAWMCLHILVYDGRLFLIGGVEEFGVRARIGIWEMDWETMEWRAYCFMPEEVFVVFTRAGSHYFVAVDRKGMICFLSNKRFAGAAILMCDLSVKRWWRPRACERRSIEIHSCFVHAVEPYIDLVKGSE